MTSNVTPGRFVKDAVANSPDQPLTMDAVEAALDGDDSALHRLLDRLTPIVQSRVARGLFRRLPSHAHREVRQEVEDLSQDIFLLLFADDGKILRSWQESRGLSLENFVGLVAERRTATALSSGKKSPWKEDPTLVEELDRVDDEPSPEAAAASRQELGALLDRLEEELSPLGRQLFELLYLQEKSVKEVTRETGLSSDAVYAWRSRLRKLANRLFRDISSFDVRNRRAGQNDLGGER